MFYFFQILTIYVRIGHHSYRSFVNLTGPYSESSYNNPDGIIFLTVGTAGDELKEIVDRDDYYVIQENDEFGFPNLKVENKYTLIVGEFHSNDEDTGIIDHVELSK